MAWKIRFYSGLNQGAEVSLGEGRVALGSDPLQADLVLLDEGIAAVHLVLEVDAQGVRLLEWAEGCEPRQDGQAQVAGAILQALAGQTCGPLRWAFCDPQRSFPERFPEVEAQTAPVRRKPSARAGGASAWRWPCACWACSSNPGRPASTAWPARSPWRGCAPTCASRA